ncbi:MAG: UPF0449 family protein, partial [Chloroflexota bacterium]|nr:UPF0449 family protein [Chloroflexota bacterium]
MGQYQQWQHYLKVDQQLRAQLETLEAKLALLQEDGQHLDEPDLSVDNQLLCALIARATILTSAPLSEHMADLAQQSASSSQHTEGKPTPFISSALFARSSLSPFETQASPVQEQQPVVLTNNTPPTLPPIPHSEADLLPADMAAFFDAHAQT